MGAAIIPAVIVTICLYYMIFNMMATEIGAPEGVTCYILPVIKRVSTILILSAPITIAVILFLAYKITHRMVGSFERILRDLDRVIDGKKTNAIGIRKNDHLAPLIEKINKLIERIHKLSPPPPPASSK